MMNDPTRLSLEQARELLRGTVLKCTSCRLAVLMHLAHATHPLTHADVAESLSPQGFDRSTIYRSLVEMAEAGLLARLELGDRTWRFELRRAHGRSFEAHPHFVCVDCGSVSCLPGVNLDLQQVRGPAGPGRVTEVLLRGHCQDCHPA